jgi:hypothetical protein
MYGRCGGILQSSPHKYVVLWKNILSCPGGVPILTERMPGPGARPLIAVLRGMQDMMQLIGSGLLAFTKILGMDREEAEKLCRDGIAATKNKNLSLSHGT